MPRVTGLGEHWTGVNTKVETEFDHNNLESNIQNGDINEQKTNNLNVDETIQKETSVFHTINVSGDFTFNSGLGQHGGSAVQTPKTKNFLSEAHAITILFTLIGLAVLAIAIGIGISCCKRRKRKEKKTMLQKIELHREISRSQRELNLIKEIQALKTQIGNSKMDSVIVNGDNKEEIQFSSSSDISEI